LIANLDRALIEAWKSLLGYNGFPTLSAIWGHPNIQNLVQDDEEGKRLMKSKGPSNEFFAGVGRGWRCTPRWLMERLFTIVASQESAYRVVGTAQEPIGEICPRCKMYRDPVDIWTSESIVCMPQLSVFVGRICSTESDFAGAHDEDHSRFMWTEADAGKLPLSRWETEEGDPLLSSMSLLPLSCHNCSTIIPANSFILGTEAESQWFCESCAELSLYLAAGWPLDHDCGIPEQYFCPNGSILRARRFLRPHYCNGCGSVGPLVCFTFVLRSDAFQIAQL
jgi:hypothetical protein